MYQKNKNSSLNPIKAEFDALGLNFYGCGIEDSELLALLFSETLPTLLLWLSLTVEVIKSTIIA